jgi:hypothetical protein
MSYGWISYLGIMIKAMAMIELLIDPWNVDND